MKIYIASSWKNQHAVEMLTSLLRGKGHEVISWVENNYGENHYVKACFDFEEWVNSIHANQSFEFDTNGAMNCDLLIYVGVAGKDACAETGMAYAKKIPILGLRSKGEDLGLMRKMMTGWYNRIEDLLEGVEVVNSTLSK